jgi:hypothetical protein
MRNVAYVLFAIGALVLVNGAVSFYFRYNFITQERYGPTLVPIYIIGAGIGILVLGLVANTIAGGSKKK